MNRSAKEKEKNKPSDHSLPIDLKRPIPYVCERNARIEFLS